jgi:Zn-dependent alcohol dehydrogenase
LGHEGCGIVQEIGPGVTNVQIGQKVVMHWRPGKGIDSQFPKYAYGEKVFTSGKVTTFSEFSIVSENRLTPVPEDTPPELAALLGCGMTTAFGVVTNESGIKFGESIAVVGCGGVGLNLLQAAQMASATPIIAIDINDNKSELAKNNGASYFVNSQSDMKELDFVTDNLGIDIIIDTTGNSELIGKLIPKLSNSGRFVLVSQGGPSQKISFLGDSNFFGDKGKHIWSTQGGRTDPTQDIQRYLKLYKAGYLTYEKMITHRFELNSINEALDTLRSGEAGRIMIQVNGA